MATLRWDNRPSDFTGLSSVVFNLDASHWSALGACFIADESFEPREPLATGDIQTQLGPGQRFGIVDEGGGITTLLVPPSEQPQEMVGSALLFALAGEGYVDLEKDVLQTHIGAVRPQQLEQPFGEMVVADLDQFREMVLDSTAEATARFSDLLRDAAEANPESPSSGSAEASSMESSRSRASGGSFFPDEDLRRSRRRRRHVAREALAWAGGGYPEVLALAPRERASFMARGLTLLTGATIAGAATASALHDWMRTSLVVSMTIGLLLAVMMLNYERFLLLSMRRQATRLGTIGAALPRLVLSFVLGAMVAELVVLRVFSNEITAEVPQTNGRPPSLLEAADTLNRLTSGHWDLFVTRLLLELFFILAFMGPVLLTAVTLLGRPTLYELIEENQDAHLLARLRAEEELHDVAMKVTAAQHEVEDMLSQGRTSHSSDRPGTVPPPETPEELFRHES